MRRIVTGIITAVVIVGLLLLMRMSQPKGSTASLSRLAYSVARAHYGNLNVTVTGSGSVQAGQSLNVVAQESGTVQSVPVVVGSHVGEGQVLAYVGDSGALEGSLLQAKAQLAADQASLQQLVSPTPATSSQIAAARAQVAADEAALQALESPTAAQIQVAQDRVQADESKLQADEASQADLTVTAPFSGQIASVGVSPGDLVASGSPLFEVVQPGDVQVTTSIPEIDLPNIYIGMGVQVWTQVQGTMQAAVTTIGVTSSGSGRQGALFPVTLQIENPPSGLRQGMQATVNFTQAYLTTAGTVAFANTETVPAQVSGTVETVSAQVGQTVQAGQTLVTLSSPSLAIQIASDQASLVSDQTTLQELQHPTQSQVDASRAQLAQAESSLAQLLSPTRPTADQVASAKARVASDEATVAEAQQALGNLDIRSPIAGVVTAVGVQQGSVVAPGAGTLFTVEAPNSLQVVVPVSEISIAQVKVGQDTTVTANALPGETFAGTVAQIAPAGVTSQGVATFNVTVDVAHPGDLRAGMSADIATHVASLHHVLLVPNEALTGYGKSATLQVVVHGAPKLRHVVMGLSNETETQILSGLKAGAEVVTAQASTGTLQLGPSSSGGK